ncbi:hypothetical protein K438DRAFT_1968529 [Mycena galopus ATCC 62051]|nr:hypothetical protein K438DRAFT_1968529 [Mycena galopus ATCC 62051]
MLNTTRDYQFPSPSANLTGFPSLARPPFGSFVHEMHRVPAAHVGLLQQHDIGRDALSDYDTTSRMLEAPRAYDLTLEAVPSTPGSRAAPILSGDLSVLGARLRAPQLGCATPAPAAFIPHRIHRFPCPACDDYLRQWPSLPRLPCSRSPKYHPHAPPPACGALAGLFTIGTTPVRYHHHVSPLRLPGLPSTQEYPTRPTRSATGMHSARHRLRLNRQEAVVAYSRRPSAAQPRAGPPCSTSDRLPWASSVPASLERDVRDPPRLPADRLQHYHTARDSPRHSTPATRCTRCTARLGRHLLRAAALRCCPTPTRPTPRQRAPSADPHRQPHGQCSTLAFVVPHAAFVASPCSATFITSTARRAPPTLFNTTRNASRVRGPRHGRSSPLAPPSSPSHTPPPSTLDARGLAQPQYDTEFNSLGG